MTLHLTGSKHERRAALLLPLEDPRTLARVVAVERGVFSVCGDVDATYASVGHGSVDGVCVGDLVDVDALTVLPRTTLLARDDRGKRQALAANVDEVWCVVAADQGLNPRRLERALLLAYDGGAVPVVVVSKADLLGDDGIVDDVGAVAPGVDVVVSSAKDGVGVDVLRARVSGRAAVVLGVSGAGKSALVNAIVGSDVAAEGEVQADARGRHTTTSRSIVVVPTGGLLLDTPGLRAFGVAVDDDALARAFPEIELLAAGCRFRDCSHEHEPGCAVRGVVDDDRLRSFFQLKKEAASARERHEAASNDAARAAAQRAQKAKHKAMTLAGWQHSHDKRRGRT